MSVDFHDGFDQYGTSASHAAQGAYSRFSVAMQTAVVPPNCTYAARVNNGTGITRILKTAAATIGFGARFNLNSLAGTDFRLLQFLDTNGVVHVTISVNASGGITAYRGNVATLLGSSANGVLVTGAWYHIEAKVVCHDTTGAVTVKVNNVERLALTNQDTKNSAVTTIDQVAIESASNLFLFYTRDLAAWNTNGAINNDFLGTKRTFTLFATADTAVTDFQRSGGTDDYAAIDEVPPNDLTDYIYGTAAGNVSEFTMEDLPAGVTGVIAMSAWAKLQKSDAGAGEAKLGFKFSATSTVGATIAPGTSFAYYDAVFETNPDGSTLTASSVNASLLRVERTV